MSGLKILLADKSYIARCMIKKTILNDVPELTVLEADNCYDVLDHLKKKDIDLAVIDVQMPRINGIVLTKKAPSKLPIILISYCDECYYKKNLPSENILGILQKPVDPIDFFELMKKGGFDGF